MKRILLNSATVLALVFCVIVGTLWVRSYLVGETVAAEWCTSNATVFHGLRVRSSGGGVSLASATYAPIDPKAQAQAKAAVNLQPFQYERTAAPFYPSLGSQSHFLGFYAMVDRSEASVPARRLTMPYWSVALAAAALPLFRLTAAALSAAARRRVFRTRLGICLTCGYDLRGNVSGVCPECGTDVQAVNGAGGVGAVVVVTGRLSEAPARFSRG